MNIWLNFLLDSLAFGATFVYGSTGEILTEKAGHLNLGIPGIMCVGGAGGAFALNFIGTVADMRTIEAMTGFGGAMAKIGVVLAGIVFSFFTAAAMGLLYSFLTVTLRANQNVTGLAMTTFGVGLMKVVMSKMDSLKYLIVPKNFYRWPFANQLDARMYFGVMFWLAIVIAVAGSFVLFRTKVGLHLRAVGENPATADAVGINVTAYKYGATLIGSGIAGLGGFYYMLDYMASQEAYLSLEAFGWLSIALVIFAIWRPHLTIVGSLVFGFLFSCSSLVASISWMKIAQTMAAKPILKMLPYIVTIIVLIVTSIRNKRENQPPASLGLSYFREER